MDDPQAPDSSIRGRDRGFVVALYTAILAASVFGFAALFVISARYPTGGIPGGFAAIGLIVYTFGLRHGFDADHIAAIDNTTRKLLQENKRPLTVGTWFSLGHSTIVIGLIVVLVFAVQLVNNQIGFLRSAGTFVGTIVSGVFLTIIGLVNLVIVFDIYRVFRGLKERRFDARQFEEQLSRRGFMNRYFGRLFRVVDSPRQIYPIGVLFGLGFDTATEVALVGIAVTLGVAAIPIYAILVLPLLFTCGMVLVDTTDCIAMNYAYRWAFLKPIRKVYYNLTITVISVLVAFVVGGVELLQVLARELGWGGGLWFLLTNLDFESLGIAVVAVFVLTWGVATAYYRYRRFDEISFESSPSSPGEPVA
jgi:nickel/cobalt transporter (NiCoT) family protein